MSEETTASNSIQDSINEMMNPRYEALAESDTETESSVSSSSVPSITKYNMRSSSDKDSSSENGDDDDEEESEYEVDLSENEIYKGLYSFFEDDEGHNILDYISLLHTELIGIGKTMTNLKVIRKDVTRIADCFEKLVALKEFELEEKRNRKMKMGGSN